jgi:hypothetical protein
MDKAIISVALQPCIPLHLNTFFNFFEGVGKINNLIGFRITSLAKQ